MNWAAFGAFTSLFSIVCTLGGVAYLAGKFTQRIEDNENRLDDHHDRLKVHDDRLNSHDKDIARFAEWKEGFNAASRVSGSKEIH